MMRLKLADALGIAVALLGIFSLPASTLAQSKGQPNEVTLSVKDLPNDVWHKKRIVPSISNGDLLLRDEEGGTFDDASFWEIEFNTDLSFGRKEFLVDVTVGEDHMPLWGGSLLQPLLNGKEAVPALDDNGIATTELLISDYDGKGFIPAKSGTYRFQMAATDEKITSFALMTAGADNYEVTLSNFRVNVWPEVDARVFPQQPRVSSLNYMAGEPVSVFIDWNNDSVSRETTKAELTLTGPSGEKQVTVRLPRVDSAISGSRVSRVSLGKLAPGDYTLQVPATGDRTTPATASFRVLEGTSHFEQARNDAWSAFYWITSGAHGPYPEAHPQDAIAQVFDDPSQTQDVTGGWYDAGDYGKYTVNGAYSASLMLLTGLLAGDALDHTIEPVANVPASVPDWLRVVDAELSWLNKMQRSDGAVYHKATTRQWPSMTVKPEEDLDIKWLMPVTTTATADFAATMALAAIVYDKQSDAAYKNRAAVFRVAAERALAWLDQTPDLKMIQISYDGETYGGAYDDESDLDERFFAHSAFALMTGEQDDFDRAQAAMEQRFKDLQSDEFALDWRAVSLLGFWALAASDDLPTNMQETVNDALRAAAYRKRVLQNRSSWSVSIGDDGQLLWGSNSVFATSVWHWLLYAQHSGEDRYVENAQRQMHYFFGQNPLGITFVTGAADNSAKQPHFRPWSSGRISLPSGFLVGGPNSTNLAGDPLTGALAGRAPMRMYADDVQSYATNEVAINWQSTWALATSLMAAALDQAD